MTPPSNMQINEYASPSTPATVAADAEVEALLARVQLLIPAISDDAATRAVRMLRMLHADCKSAHAALGRVPLRNECGDCSESDSNTSGPVAQLGFDGDDDDEDSDDDNSEEDGSGSNSGNSSPSSPGAQRQRDRQAYEVRRSAADAQQRSRVGLRSLVSNQLKCCHCVNEGELGQGECEAFQMLSMSLRLLSSMMTSTHERHFVVDHAMRYTSGVLQGNSQIRWARANGKESQTAAFGRSVSCSRTRAVICGAIFFGTVSEQVTIQHFEPAQNQELMMRV